MVKFGQRLVEELVVDGWEDNYLRYKPLKKIISKLSDAEVSGEMVQAFEKQEQFLTMIKEAMCMMSVGSPRQPPRQQGAPPQQRQEPPPSRPGIPVGTARKLAGLASRPELNGLSCIVQGYDAGSGRYRVEYEAAGVRAMISVQPGKLGAAMPPPPPRAPNSQRERLDAHKHGRR